MNKDKNEKEELDEEVVIPTFQGSFSPIKRLASGRLFDIALKPFNAAFRLNQRRHRVAVVRDL